jgi:prepilin-type N-terminal cleavage/methylation domain-containing protein
MKKHLKNKKGFTLVELLITIAIFIVIGGIASVFIFQGFNFYRDELSANVDESSVRNGMTQIVNTLHKTTSDKISVSSNQLTVNGKVYSKSGSNITYDGKTVIKNISGFSVTNSSNTIEISITTSEGRTIRTSFALR